MYSTIQNNRVIPLAGGLPGTIQTVGNMVHLASSGSLDPRVRLVAERIVAPIKQRNYHAESKAVEKWVRDHLRYTRDGLQVETLKSPQVMLSEIRQHGKFTGDCDDAAILISSLLLTIGHSPAFQVLGRGKHPHHVNVFDGSTGLTLDATGKSRGHYGFQRRFNIARLNGLS